MILALVTRSQAGWRAALYRRTASGLWCIHQVTGDWRQVRAEVIGVCA
jgi:hypothetical protein